MLFVLLLLCAKCRLMFSGDIRCFVCGLSDVVHCSLCGACCGLCVVCDTLVFVC